MIIIALLIAVFIAGAMAGTLALVVLAIRREDRDQLPRRAPTRATAAARNLMGLHVGGTRPATHAGLPARPATHGPRPGPPGHAAPRPPRQPLPTS